MTRSSDFFDEFGPHTHLKLAILRAYVGRWAMKLLQWGGGGPVVYVVDGFAGPGRDKRGNDGSPTLIARIAAETEGHLRDNGFPDVRMRLIAVEKKRSHYEALHRHLEPFNSRAPSSCSARRGELVEHIDAIVAETAGAPTLFFLDPFGVKGLDRSTYPKMLAGAQNEMFVLFADMGAGRLHGAVIAEAANLDEQVQQLHEDLAFFPEMRAAEEAALRASAAESAEALDFTQSASREHLSRALGDEWQRELERMSLLQRPDAFLRIFNRVLVEAGARRVLTLPVRDETGRRVYSLVYATKSLTGFVTMKEAIVTGLGHEELPPGVCQMIRDDLRISVAEMVGRLENLFAGRKERWTAARGERVFSIRRWVLENTAMVPFQCDELKAALKARGYLTTEARRPVVQFPAAAE